MDQYQETFHTWDQLASAYHERFMEMDLYNDTYDNFCKLITKRDPKILEIGCGPGNITKHLLSKRPDFKLLGLDIAPSMIKFAQLNNPGAGFEMMDAREIDKLEERFDGIICGFCLPYLSKEDALKLIKDCFALLNKEGILYLSAIEGDYDKSGIESSSDGKHSMFVYYHEADYLENYLKRNGFELIGFVRKEFSKQNGTLEVHMILIARKSK
jgi:2-polyprenyl-3-methyl-5-hydroxy-6-metoxy-1,4-benzoquinol methylase